MIPPLIHLLATAEFDIKKEAAWAISNATSGGSHPQIRYLVEQVRSPVHLSGTLFSGTPFPVHLLGTPFRLHAL